MSEEKEHVYILTYGIGDEHEVESVHKTELGANKRKDKCKKEDDEGYIYYVEKFAVLE